MAQMLAVQVYDETGLDLRLSAECFVKPLPALGLRLAYKPLLERPVEAEVLTTASAGDGVIVLGRIRFVNSEGGPALVALEGEGANLMHCEPPAA